MCVRIGFGLSLAFVGIAHYRDAATYAEFVGRGLGPIEQVGMVWGYILPALMIVGGVLLATGFGQKVGAYAAGIALASIPAGLMLKSAITGIPVDQTMPNAVTALVWIIVLLLCVKKGSCGMGCNCAGGVCTPGCNCPGCEPTPVVKSVSSMPAVSVKAPVKKAPARKKSARKSVKR